ncbi:SDR family oxidoreductase [Pseudooceanicola sp. CBS1P-1]|uniref:SDR family oxidoreductase n=1 Tax=Pseudooceanicola albus TaxID=2692189 RepID=A0A6L7G6B6_9RHOB|nr:MULTISPECIES: SDR family oxidoreductase [Pseudooceanicola]MBT9385281.1 SDR family oxidoreductase [Pseudooceanicola endophyticus]MXN18860.1 SDR family oxidoreductase [Pseudooceanicola albus]
MKLSGFDGQTAFVTGAAGGIGQAMVHLLREAGARVLATDHPDALAALAPASDDRVLWRPLDVRDAEAAEARVAEAEARFGPLSLGVHAAGVLATGNVLDCPPAEWQRVMEINAGGTYAVGRAMGAAMARHGAGAMVVISSNAAGIPRAGMGAYAASKAAVTMLTRCLGLELAAQGVRCNILAPGSTLTPMQTGMWADDSGARRVIEGDLASHRTGIPLGKLATPEDIARAAMFLLSQEAGHITMADLYVDGGATLRG